MKNRTPEEIEALRIRAREAVERYRFEKRLIQKIKEVENEPLTRYDSVEDLWEAARKLGAEKKGTDNG